MNLKQKILEATDGGLTILKDLFPFFEEKKQFKAEEDETSESAKAKYDNGQWKVCVFDADRAPSEGYHNAIDWYMWFNKMEFTEAIKQLAIDYGITNGAPAGMKIELLDEKNEYTGYRIPEEIRTPTEDECKSLGRYVKPEHCEKLGVFYLESYKYTNDKGETRRFEASDTNPFFYLSFEKKIYAPKSAEKRFRYMATEPMPDANKTLHNLENIEKELTGKSDDGIISKTKHLIICCGYRDALNAHSIGYDVVWMSSESLKITHQLYKRMTQVAHFIYYCNDLDSTGVKMAHQTCMSHLDIKRIYLPQELLTKKDFRGKACKDLTDYLKEYGDIGFKILVDSAAPYRFWYDYLDSKGYNKTKISRHWLKLFIIANGFRRYQFDDGKGYIQIQGNAVRKVEQEDIKAWVNWWAQSRGFGRDILDMISGTRDLSESVLNELPMAELKFSTADHDYQLMVFEQEIWMITPDTIKKIKHGDIDTYVWNYKIGLRQTGQIIHPKKGMKFTPELHKKHIEKSYKPDLFFDIIKSESGLDIKINRKNSEWFRFLINTCRVHWKKEVNGWAAEKGIQELPMAEKKRRFVAEVDIDITSKYLSEEENKEHKVHLLNRLFTMGYLMHRHKFRNKSWLTWCMDYKVESIKDSKGRSGKSIIPQAFEHLKTFATENGRDHNLTKKNHIFADVTSLTDLLIINDSHNYLDLGFFFNYITDNISVNPKNVAQRTIPFDEAGKMLITANFSPMQLDDSTLDRILFNLFSDWYHSEKDFGFEYRPSHDFGHNLFADWDESEWNSFYNFMAQCCMHHFTMPKCQSPLEQVIKRDNLRMAGDVFTDWANEALLPLVNRPILNITEEHPDDATLDGLVHYESGVGTFIVRTVAHKLYNEYAGQNKISMNAFTKKIKSWAATQSIELDPENVRSTDGRVKKSIAFGGTKKLTECLFLYQSNPDVPEYSGTGPLPINEPPY